MRASIDTNPVVKPNRRTFRLVLAGIVVFMALWLTGVVAVVWLTSKSLADDGDASDAAKTHAMFELALEELRLRDAYSLTSPRFQRETDFEQFRDLIDRHPIVKGRSGNRWTKDENRTVHEFDSHKFIERTDVTSDGRRESFTYVIIVPERGRAMIDSLTFEPRKEDGE